MWRWHVHAWRYGLPFVLPLALLCTSLPTMAAPDDATAVEASNEVLVESARDRDAAAGVPAVQASVTREQLTATVNLYDVEDALKYLPSIDVRKRYVGDRSSPLGSRVSAGIGFSARGLVYSDGLLLANLLGNDNNDYTPRWGMVAPEEVARIDVLYGPYSALYPGNSMGAVVKMITRMPERFEAHVKAQYFTQQFSAYATDDRYDGQQYSAVLGDRSGDFSAWLSVNHLNSLSQPIAFAPITTAPVTGIATISGALQETDQYGARRYIVGGTSIDDTTQDTAKLKLAYDFGNALRATYTLGYWQNRSDIGFDSYLRDATGNTVLSGNVNVGGGQRIAVPASTFGLQHQTLAHILHGLELSQTSGDLDWRVTASAYDYRDDERRRQNASTGTAGTLTNLDGTNWRTLDGIATWNASASIDGHHLTVGAHLDRYVLDTLVQNVTDWRSSSTGTRASAFGGRTETRALFVQDAWGFAAGWQATLGLRHENWRADRGSVSNATTQQTFASRSESYFSPKLALQWKPAADWTLRTSLARAYRLPTVAELFQGTIPNTQNTVNYNNPDLRPERVTSAEFNAEHEFRIGLASGWVRGTAFYEGNRDALIRQPVPPTDPNFNLATGAATFWSNVDFVRSRGFELAWHAQNAGLRGLDVDGSLTYAQSLIVEDKAQPSYVDNWQNRVPKWRARLLGSYRASDSWSFAAGGRYSGLQRNGYPNADIRPNTYLGFAPYLVFDARATWKPMQQVTVAAGVDNLTNRLYYQFHPYPRRTFNLELRYDY
jgi:iron complex outermembrane receptor protein